MFEGLRNSIMLDNLIKIRNQQRQIERNGQELGESYSDEGQSAELNERLEIFKVLMEDNHQDKQNKVSANSMAWSKCARMTQQIELLQEQLAIQAQQHQRQLKYQAEKYESELSALKAEIEKYQYQCKKQQKEQNLVLSLKKQNRQLFELQSEKDDIIQRMSMQLKTHKSENKKLKLELREKQEEVVNLNAIKHFESENEKKLKENVQKLKEDLKHQQERKKHYEYQVNKLRQENEQLMRENDKQKIYKEQQKQLIADMYKGDIKRLEQQVRQLKIRNQKLQESFIDHLTQTSLNLQQNIKQAPQQRTKTSSMYLPDSPIRTRSKGRERPHSPNEEQDPEKGHCAGNKCSCTLQVTRLKTKLRQANGKIVELLQQKCIQYSQK